MGGGGSHCILAAAAAATAAMHDLAETTGQYTALLGLEATPPLPEHCKIFCNRAVWRYISHAANIVFLSWLRFQFSALASGGILFALFSAPFWFAGYQLAGQAFAGALTHERFAIGRNKWRMAQVSCCCVAACLYKDYCLLMLR